MLKVLEPSLRVLKQRRAIGVDSMPLTLRRSLLATVFSFGRFELRPASRELIADGRPVPLGARAFDVLHALIERRERLVTKNELLDLVWPGVVVEENNLQVQISTLRKLLGPQSIATIPGRGYRFSVALDGAPEGAPVSLELAATNIDGNLPTPRDSLYGREDDLRMVSELLHQHTLVLIVGAGGIGKTRLAQAVTIAEREHYPDGVWWVDLASLNDAKSVVSAIAHALGVRAGGERPLLETVITLLRKQTALLVLDNCEHLLDAVADCVQRLITHAPGLRVMVTTQEALRIPEEHVYRLGGLPFDGVSSSPAAACLLFIARANAADPRLRLNEINLPSVREICRQLDGIPLAIELAAARVRLLGVDGVRARLDERFHILTGGTRALLRRHQTLRAALEWSHGLLSSDEQIVFRRLGVFVGGFNLELGQAVAYDERIDRWTVLDLLGHLVDKSLVVAEGTDAVRYRLLETMRAFALERLADAGEMALLMRRHAAALLEFLTPFHSTPRRHSLTHKESAYLGGELDNLRTALAWAGSLAGDRALGCELVAVSAAVWHSHELHNEGIDCAQRLLPLPADTLPETEAAFNLALAALGFLGARNECFIASLRAAELYRSLGNAWALVDALSLSAIIGSARGEAKIASAAIAEAETLIGPQTPARRAARLALAKAGNYFRHGQYERAVESALEQAALHRSENDEWDAQLALSNAAIYECGLGRFDAAIARLHTALEILTRMDAPFGIGQTLVNLARVYALSGDRSKALAYGRKAVPHSQRMGWTARMLHCLALAHARCADESRAVCLASYFETTDARVGRIPTPLQVTVHDEIQKLARATLSPTELDRYAAIGGTMSEERAIAVAFDIESSVDELISLNSDAIVA